MECPSLFGLGQPADAVEKVNAFLDEAERVDAQVGYRVVLRICDVLSKRHPLFAGLHSEKIKPSALTERRNARPELIRLVDEISTILLNIGDNTQHWKANQEARKCKWVNRQSAVSIRRMRQTYILTQKGTRW